LYYWEEIRVSGIGKKWQGNESTAEEKKLPVAAVPGRTLLIMEEKRKKEKEQSQGFSWEAWGRV